MGQNTIILFFIRINQRLLRFYLQLLLFISVKHFLFPSSNTVLWAVPSVLFLASSLPSTIASLVWFNFSFTVSVMFSMFLQLYQQVQLLSLRSKLLCLIHEGAACTLTLSIVFFSKISAFFQGKDWCFFENLLKFIFNKIFGFYLGKVLHPLWLVLVLLRLY
jgi:hypothetical protein